MRRRDLRGALINDCAFLAAKGARLLTGLIQSYRIWGCGLLPVLLALAGCQDGRKTTARASEIECGYRDGLAEGICRDRYPDGKLKSECGYARGKKTGPCVWFYPDGKKANEAVFVSDSAVGESRSWYRNGAIESIVTDTLAVHFFPDGKVEMKTRWLNGLENGRSERWWPNGRIRETREFRNGHLHGTTKSYSPEGRLEAIYEYDSGKPVPGHGAYGNSNQESDTVKGTGK